MTAQLHLVDPLTPKLTYCGMWSRIATILGDEPEGDLRHVCLRCVRRRVLPQRPEDGDGSGGQSKDGDSKP